MSVDYSCLHNSSWLLNANNGFNKSAIFSSQTEVLSSEGQREPSNSWQMSSNQIPLYLYNFSLAVVSTLNSRPRASTDFVGGRTTAVAGQRYIFGSNIGYATTTSALGYWPPGVAVSPIPSTAQISFNLRPAPEISPGIDGVGRDKCMYGCTCIPSYDEGELDSVEGVNSLRIDLPQSAT